MPTSLLMVICLRLDKKELERLTDLQDGFRQNMALIGPAGSGMVTLGRAARGGQVNGRVDVIGAGFEGVDGQRVIGQRAEEAQHDGERGVRRRRPSPATCPPCDPGGSAGPFCS